MNVHLVEHIASGAPFVAPALLERLTILARESAAPVLHAAGASVDVSIEVHELVGRPPNGAAVTLRARESSRAFPVFTGTLCVDPIDALSSELVLSGTYSVPLGAAGVIVDRTMLAGVAAQSLQALLTDVRDAVAAATFHRVMGV